MITQQQARSMLNHPVHDAEGVRIGKADHVYLDDATGKPQWVSVRTGWFGSSESFVPIGDAKVVDDHLQVPYPKEKVKAAPMVALEEGGHLARREERRLYQHYGIATGNGGRAAERTAAGGGATAPAVVPAGSPLVTPTPAGAIAGGGTAR